MKKAVTFAAVLVGISAFMAACGAKNEVNLATEEMYSLENPANGEAGSTQAASTDDASQETSSTEENQDISDKYAYLYEAESLDDTLKKAVNGFNWKLYDISDKDKNLFYSPYSIESALALTDLGAEGDTKKEIESALGIEDATGFAKQIKLYASEIDSEQAKLTCANSVWIDKSLSLSEKFEQEVKNPVEFYYGGDIKSVDFANDSAKVKSEISDWVKTNTGDMIADYEAAADENTVADIINAIYFYGEWQNKFEHDSTAKQEFNGTDGSKEVDMMHQNSLSLKYVADADGVTAAALPYGNGDVEMDIIMSSDKSKNIADVWDSSKADSVFEAIDKSELTEIGMLAVPKFTLDEDYSGLNDALKELGIKKAFEDGADFSAIADNLKISNISHKAKIEVDEEGSKAAAVTEVVMELTSALEEKERPDFIVNRPFIFTIRDSKNGVILFTGRVNNL